MAPDDLPDQYWEAARLAIHGAYQDSIDDTIPMPGDPKEILKFLDYHLALHGAGENYMSSITAALNATSSTYCGRPPPLMVEGIRNFNCTSPSFVRGMRSILHSGSPTKVSQLGVCFVALISDQWFNSPVPIMKPEEMSGFCEYLAVFMIDTVFPLPSTRRHFFSIFFGMLRSPEWRTNIVTRLWSLLAYWTLVGEEEESFKWCLKNAIEKLEFTRRLPDGEGFKWWYGTLWFHFNKLDSTIRSEVESIAKGMSLGDGLSDLDLYLNLIGQEVERTQQELNGLTEVAGQAEAGMVLRARIVTLEGNYRRLARITGER